MRVSVCVCVRAHGCDLPRLPAYPVVCVCVCVCVCVGGTLSSVSKLAKHILGA
jgi:hypothetical protein